MARAGSSCLRDAANFIEHFPAATDAHIALLRLPQDLSGTPLHETLTTTPYRVRATVSGSGNHPGLGPRERSRTLRLNKAAAIPTSEAGPSTSCAATATAAGADAVEAGAAGTSAAADALAQSAAALDIEDSMSTDSDCPPPIISDKQRAFLLAKKLCIARGSGTCASLQDQPLEHAGTVNDKSITLKYHAMNYRALPTLHLRGSPLLPSAVNALMSEVECMRFQVRRLETYSFC